MSNCIFANLLVHKDETDLTASFTQDMIHIADTKVARRYGDFFIRQIHKFEEVSHLSKRVKMTFESCLK